MTALVWLRRELRLHDNPPLRAALARHDVVVPVFCLDERLLGGRHASGPRTQFMLECLEDLDAGLRARGSGLIVRSGAPEHELPRLARHLRADTVYTATDVSPFATARDRRTAAALAGVGATLRHESGVFAADGIELIRTGAGNPYTVFSPFYRNWLARPRREVLAAPRGLPPLPERLARGRVPTLERLGLTQTASAPARGGERAGRLALRAFLAGPAQRYGARRDELTQDGCSRLSPHLHFGCVSVRELEASLPAGEHGEELRRQLCWRDFFAHVIANFPRNAVSEHQARYRGTLRYSHARRRFEAWQQGSTGYPLVDAAMRQLASEGWIHNRLRMVVGSFLTKDLAIDWRWGERWFMQTLLDGDEASNNGNWQWIASVGVDPQPLSRRILSPRRQQERFDPSGAYVRRYVPELARVPDHHLAEPAAMAPELARAVGCVIGRDYPPPIVDHSLARRATLERYASAITPRAPRGSSRR